MKALIVYGTRYGATAGTSEEIGKVLREEGFDVRIVNSTKEKVKDITEYQLIVVGSGIKMGKWIKEPEQFLNNFQKEITTKKVAIFISSAIQAIYEHEGNIEEMEKAWKKNLEEKASKYALNPVNMAIFGGVFHYDDMG
ncbi:MAG: flavodoxin domain-containing protein, partial [Promethearchaeota archaeon]